MNAMLMAAKASDTEVICARISEFYDAERRFDVATEMFVKADERNHELTEWLLWITKEIEMEMSINGKVALVSDEVEEAH